MTGSQLQLSQLYSYLKVNASEANRHHKRSAVCVPAICRMSITCVTGMGYCVQVSMEDGDSIDVVIHQVGGSKV